MVRPIRKKQIPHLPEAIEDTAWNQIAAHGASALSLRAIARALKITAPAIYNYFPDRDALVTALIIDAYTSFGDSQIEASDISGRDPRRKLEAIGLAYRNWAHTYPQRYQLIFGTPIPGYHAPAEKVFPASARSISALFAVVEELRAAGRLVTDALPTVSERQRAQYEVWRAYAGKLHPQTLIVAMIIWSRVHGIVSLEIQGNLPPLGRNGDALYRFELNACARQFIKE